MYIYVFRRGITRQGEYALTIHRTVFTDIYIYIYDLLRTYVALLKANWKGLTVAEKVQAGTSVLQTEAAGRRYEK
jgi:hypothetical protein